MKYITLNVNSGRPEYVAVDNITSIAHSGGAERWRQSTIHLAGGGIIRCQETPDEVLQLLAHPQKT